MLLGLEPLEHLFLYWESPGGWSLNRLRLFLIIDPQALPTLESIVNGGHCWRVFSCLAGCFLQYIVVCVFQNQLHLKVHRKADSKFVFQRLLGLTLLWRIGKSTEMESHRGAPWDFEETYFNFALDTNSQSLCVLMGGVISAVASLDKIKPILCVDLRAVKRYSPS
jgi:hypothetical protein